MHSSTLLVTEIFHSLQGETSLSGLRFGFVRLTGCNLRCSYCDSAYAFKGGKRMSINEILESLSPWGVRHVLVTGGEPLMQRPTPELIQRLNESGYLVSLETHGEAPIASVSPLARIVLDIKTPSSGMSRGGYRDNLKHLKASDEVKFVIASESDYEWARDIVRSGQIPVQEILFSPAVVAQGMPGKFPGVTHAWLANRILEDRLSVRMQTQFHKLIWGSDQRGV